MLQFETSAIQINVAAFFLINIIVFLWFRWCGLFVEIKVCAPARFSFAASGPCGLIQKPFDGWLNDYHHSNICIWSFQRIKEASEVFGLRQKIQEQVFDGETVHNAWEKSIGIKRKPSKKQRKRGRVNLWRKKEALSWVRSYGRRKEGRLWSSGEKDRHEIRMAETEIGSKEARNCSLSCLDCRQSGMAKCKNSQLLELPAFVDGEADLEI